MVKPCVGDIWEVIIPATATRKRKRIVKEIGSIYMTWYSRKDGSHVKHPYCEWKRLPKGRYSGLRVKWLLKYGTRISTAAERQAAVDKRRSERKAV
jgi:hypothetical protein